MRDSRGKSVSPGRKLSSCRGVASALSRSDASRYFLGTAMVAGCLHGPRGAATRGAHEVIPGGEVTWARKSRRSIHPRLPHQPPHTAAKTADRLVAARVWKSHWLVTLLEAYGGRLAIEATVEPPVTVSRNRGRKMPVRERTAPLNQRLKTVGKMPLKP